MHPEATYRRSATQALQAIGGTLESLNTNKSLHDALQRLLQRTDVPLDEQGRRAAENFMHDFEQSGAGAVGNAPKAEFRALTERAQTLAFEFEDLTARLFVFCIFLL